MNNVAYTRLVETIQQQSLIAVQDALVELRTLEEAKLYGRRQFQCSTKELNWELTNARSVDDLTPLAALAHLYGMKRAKGDTASCERLESIAEWLIEQGADPFLEQGRPLIRQGGKVGVRGRGRTIVEVFGYANLPRAFQKAIERVNDSQGDQARVLRYWYEREGQAA